MDTISYEEFERLPLFHMKGIMPRGRYLYTQLKLDATPLNKVEYMQECIQNHRVHVMEVTEIPMGAGMPCKINCDLLTFIPDFSDLDRSNGRGDPSSGGA